jgi:hypothetical protein
MTGNAISRRVAAAAVSVVAVSAAVGVLGASPASGAKARYPPCTKQALTAGLRHDRPPLRGRLVRPWACAGRFAASGLVADGNESTVLFRASKGVWKPTDATKYCEDGALPPRIYRMACNSN